MTKADRDIIATLTSWPVYVEQWDEYAAVDLEGVLHTDDTHKKVLESVQAHNELIARHRAAQVAAAWEAYAEAAEKARANVEAWLAEIEADKQERAQ